MDDHRITSTIRKSNKPLMEKKRRARINKSLNELKQILIESLKKSTPGHSKWEKADILEMTVSYMQCLRNQQMSTKTDPLSMGQFIAGFSECMKQIPKFAAACPDADCLSQDGQKRLVEFLVTHLNNFSDDASQALSPASQNGSPSSTTCSVSDGSCSPESQTVAPQPLFPTVQLPSPFSLARPTIPQASPLATNLLLQPSARQVLQRYLRLAVAAQQAAQNNSTFSPQHQSPFGDGLTGPTHIDQVRLPANNGLLHPIPIHGLRLDSAGHFMTAPWRPW